ncbi:MAG TPA: hypothetical protein V6D30_09325 [Leptolyngbyaceae cyanobacterium]
MSQLATSSSKYLLHHIDEDGAEYFTVISTGRAGMSQSGLARFVGVSSVSQLTKKIRRANPTINDLPECLKPFAGKTLRLPGYSDQQGRDILEDVFCAAVVEYYARWSKSKNRQNTFKAKQALELIQNIGMEFMQEKAGELIQNIGMRLFIHKKTGWQPNYNPSNSDSFEQEFVIHNERFKQRGILIELHWELMSAIKQWQKTNRTSRKIYSDTLDAMNQVVQALKSEEIKKNNNLPPSASIRDYFETRPLFDYSGLNRLAANLIRDRNIHPVEAVYEAGTLFLPRSYVPKPVPIVENVHKADKRLRAEKRKRKLAAGIQLSLPFGI